eukprot:m.28474 g.28474  ORF g.28474 m.28474 type:complete len:871 (+) comp9086_c0_seq2:192-2804(+)
MGCAPSSSAGLPVPIVKAIGPLVGREMFLETAKELGEEFKSKYPNGRKFILIFNPMASQNIARGVIDEVVRPLLDAAHIIYEIVSSKFKGFAGNFFRTYEFKGLDGILVCGDDSFFNEVVSGLLHRFDAPPCPLGVVPCGRLNALASHLDDSLSNTQCQMLFQSVLRAIRGEVRKIDLLEVTGDGASRYAVNHVGWGLPGVIGMHLDRLHWLPRRERSMETADLLTQVSHWPTSRCILAFPRRHVDDSGHMSQQWEERNIAVHGLLASTLPRLGQDNPISSALRDDDGHVVIAMVHETQPRAELVRLALEMKKGKHLADSKSVVALRVREFRLVPHADLPDVPYVVDGEPMAAGAVHVRVLPRRLPVFAAPHTDAASDEEEETIDAFKHSVVSLRRPLKDTIVSLNSKASEDLVTQEEVRQLMRHASILGRRRVKKEEKEHRKQDAATADLIQGISHAVEFVEDEFDTELESVPVTTGLAPPSLGLVERERTKLIEAVTDKEIAFRAPGHVTIIYNPVSGQGKAKRVVDQIVVAALKAANVDYTCVATQYRGFATEHVNKLDLTKTDGIIVCGGDGMVSEVITGLLQRDDEDAEDFPVGIVAVGTANAMANYLDAGRSKNHVQLVTNAALAVAKGYSTRVDVIEIKSKDSVKYALSCVGWGLAGAVGLQADKLRWVPGQKQARYDIAGFITLVTDWPVVTRGLLSYPEIKPDERGGTVEVWKSRNIASINLIASNVPKLGNDHPICKDITAQNGKIAICMIDEKTSRTDTIKAALSMKRGNFLADSRFVETVVCTEFKLTPLEGARGSKIPFNIDGDPVDASAIHVRVLHRRLRVFCLEPVNDETLSPIRRRSRGEGVLLPPTMEEHSRA